MDLLQEAKKRFVTELKAGQGERDLDLKSEVVVTRSLNPKEAIGDPKRDDFPIQRGKEHLMQASFKGALGQAYSSDASDFHGNLEDVLALPMQSIFERAVLVASMNAVLPLSQSDRWDSALQECRPEGVFFASGSLPSGEESRVRGTSGPSACNSRSDDKVGRTGSGDSLGSGRSGRRVLWRKDPGRHEFREDIREVSACFYYRIDSCQRHYRRSEEDAIEHGTKVNFYGSTISGAAFLLGLERWCLCST